MSCSLPKASNSRRAVLTTLAGLLLSASAHAQAWLPLRGEGSLSLTFQHYRFTAHYSPRGDVVPLGGSQSQSVMISADYGVTDRVAVNVAVPFARGRNGHDPSPALGRSGIDDGHYHGGLQDYRIGLQVNVLTNPVVFTPFAEVQWPSHNYPTEGEAAIGRGLRETRLGFDVGRRFDPWLPLFTGDVHVARAFVERLNGIGTDRTNVDLTLGYFVSGRWSVHAIGQWQATDGGLNFPDDVLSDSILFQSHDRILDDDHLRAGIGLSFAVNDKVDADLTYIRVLSGSNTHVGQGIALTVTRAFGTR